MLRKFMIALAAAGTLGVVATTGALAEPHFGHFGHFGHWGGPGPGFGLRFGVSPGYAYDDYGYDSCWRVHRVWTPFGWRLHRAYVCG
jgi:hypothetical protein